MRGWLRKGKEGRKDKTHQHDSQTERTFGLLGEAEYNNHSGEERLGYQLGIIGVPVIEEPTNQLRLK